MNDAEPKPKNDVWKRLFADYPTRTGLASFVLYDLITLGHFEGNASNTEANGYASSGLAGWDCQPIVTNYIHPTDQNINRSTKLSRPYSHKLRLLRGQDVTSKLNTSKDKVVGYIRQEFQAGRDNSSSFAL